MPCEGLVVEALSSINTLPASMTESAEAAAVVEACESLNYEAPNEAGLRGV